MPRRIYLENSVTNEIFEIPDNLEKIGIGRGGGMDFVLPNPKISRFHCILTRYDLKETIELPPPEQLKEKIQERLLTVTDIGSKNRTYVNREQIPNDRETEVPLSNNDILTIGPYEFIVKIVEK